MALPNSSSLVPTFARRRLDFLWLELTSLCNLECVHCYASSGPTKVAEGKLTTADYFQILDSAAVLGCRKVQFIGGEPTLVPDLPDLIELARSRDFEFIEVYTNATMISEQLLACFVRNHVALAVSFYADLPSIHDAITKREGSHARTIQTLKRVVESGLRVRAAIVIMEVNRSRVSQTIAFLKSLGIAHVGTDKIRGVGRGTDLAGIGSADLRELCGNCWRGSICITPEGVGYPCIMARCCPIGSIRDGGLSALVESEELRSARQQIYREVWLPQLGRKPNEKLASNCGPCSPEDDDSWGPCSPQDDDDDSCGPQHCSPGPGPGECGPCGPHGCGPGACGPGACGPWN